MPPLKQAQAIMNYTLNTNSQTTKPPKSASIINALRRLWPFLKDDSLRLIGSFVAILANSGLTILAPIAIGHAVDQAILAGDINKLWAYVGLILGIYAAAFVAGTIQTRLMGGVGQRILFRLRGALFNRIQELPVAFFAQNKAGDLISRINNDTDKLNQFFSRSVMQFVGNIFVIAGAAIAMLVVQPKLGGWALVPAAILLLVILATTAWVKRKNFQSLQTLGGLSAEIQESLENMKVIIAFNRRDYFRKRFQTVNEANYKAAILAGIANNTYSPLFSLASNIGTLIVIAYGLHLISLGALTFGILISYLSYVSRFYDPLRQMAQLWADIQQATAGWDRIAEILDLSSNLPVIAAEHTKSEKDTPVIEFDNVSFGYEEKQRVLDHVSFKLFAGKTYAFVGPTGGGKTTTASLIARLYDPTEGVVKLSGQDIRSVDPLQGSSDIGFILQDPFLFSGTVGENIQYGNNQKRLSNTELTALLKKEGLDDLIERFDQGLDTKVSTTGNSISLGQKQLIAFMRAVLRHPKILILDEATANIDTVTEQLLEKVLDKLPKETTRIVIAHRLNTIENADEIYFVNDGTLTKAGSLKDAVAMLTKQTRTS